jgi:hypothetical protein
MAALARPSPAQPRKAGEGRKQADDNPTDCGRAVLAFPHAGHSGLHKQDFKQQP